MCGIYGIISNSLEKADLAQRLGRMGDRQRHRGPDDKRESLFPLNRGNLGLGLARLSILDLETGMQPIICPGDGSAIVCNGQIYNYLELKPAVSDQPFVSRGDIEVGLHLYRRYGLDFLPMLNGMYAGAIYSPAEKKLLLFRDRFGIKPLYYTETREGFFFASEIKPLLAGSKEPPRLDADGLPTYFTYRYLPGEKTLFKGIKRLPPGSYLDYDLERGRYQLRRYWEYRLDAIDSSLTLDQAADRFMELLTDAVRIRLRSDVEVGSFISGGIDSAGVASLAAARRPDLRLFTMAFAEDRYNELPRVKNFLAANHQRFVKARLETRICDRAALGQLPRIIRSLEEPISLGTILPTDQVCEMAGNRLKVVLTGEGADEIFGGYRKFMIETAATLFPGLSPAEQKEMKAAYPELEAYLAVRSADPVDRYIQSEQLFSPAEIARLTGRAPAEVPFPRDARPRLSGREHPLNAAIAMETRARLPDYVILRLDKLSMRHSLETRTPFLDYRLAELAATLPVAFKTDLAAGREKALCRYALSRDHHVDQATGGHKKQPFTIPLAEWLSRPDSLPEVLREILSGDMIERQGLLDPAMVKEQQKQLSAGAVGPDTLVSAADRILSVIVLTLWYNEFFKT